MKRTISMIARLAIMAMILVPAVPAAANHGTPTQASASVTVFRGLATLQDNTGGGFFFPIGTGACNPVCPGGDGTFTLVIDNVGTRPARGVVVSVDTGVPTATVDVFGVTSTVSGTVTPGTAGLGAWCGYSSGYDGQGTANPIWLAGMTTPTVLPSVTLSRIGWIQSAATLIQSNGRAASASGLEGTIHSLSSALPIQTGGSCQTGTQTTFEVVGISVTLLTN